MKSVLMSIRPKWCEKIASGEKTIEVRKTRPKIDGAFKCYIYCTKPKSYFKVGTCIGSSNEYLHLCESKVTMGDGFNLWDKDYEVLNGKIIGEFICDDIDTISVHNETLYCENNSQANKLQQMCLPVEEIKKYLGQKNLGYNWHISDIKIYDKPKELREFYSICLEWDKERFTKKCEKCNHFARSDEDMCYVCDIEGEKPIISPPQSYCYCEEVSI